MYLEHCMFVVFELDKTDFYFIEMLVGRLPGHLATRWQGSTILLESYQQNKSQTGGLRPQVGSLPALKV